MLEWKAWRSMRRRERKVDNRRVSIAGEQLFCRRGAVPYQRAEEAEREKTQYYLIRLQPFQYVSSLFPTGEEESYTFDYEQKLYRLERKEHSVTLKFL